MEQHSTSAWESFSLSPCGSLLLAGRHLVPVARATGVRLPWASASQKPASTVQSPAAGLPDLGKAWYCSRQCCI